ncbi:hypothetical protein YC2023_034298 [Brassica napus]
MGGRDEEAEGVGEATIPLLRDQHDEAEEDGDIVVETKKLWRIVGPAIFTRITTYLILIITQAFAGHLGELELAAISIPDDIAELSGTVALWVIPIHFAFAFFFPLNRFLQCQLKNMVIAILAGVALVVHIFLCWLFVYGLKLGVIGTMATVNVSWCLNVFVLFTYATCGGCPLITWTGFSIEAFTGLWKFAKLSASSGIMLCLENWYYKILILMTGNLKDAKIAVDSIWYHVKKWIGDDDSTCFPRRDRYFFMIKSVGSSLQVKPS